MTLFQRLRLAYYRWQKKHLELDMKWIAQGIDDQLKLLASRQQQHRAIEQKIAVLETRIGLGTFTGAVRRPY
jgi:hypothetical protein